MGSCLSKKGLPTTITTTTTPNNKTGNKDKPKPTPKQDPTVERASNGAAPSPPPPPLLDDEAVVKEVLTETPVPSRRAEDVVKGAPDKCGPVPAAADDVCSCSLSDSISASTTMVGEATEDGEVEVAAPGPVAAKWRPRELPPADRGRHQRRRSASGEFPSWRAARGGAGRPLPGREATRTLRQQVGSHGDGAARVVRGGQGETSGRRSASPVARREANLRAAGGRGGGEGVGRSSSSMMRASPRRRPPPAGTAGKDADGKRGTGVEEEREEDGKLWAVLPGKGLEESLENPLVSLECFIFL